MCWKPNLLIWFCWTLLCPDVGLELCRRIKSDVFIFRHTAIISRHWVTARKTRSTGLQLARWLPDQTFKMKSSWLGLRRFCAEMPSVWKPILCRTPGNGAIERELLRCIQLQKKFSVSMRFEWFKAYNDFYGFLPGGWSHSENSRNSLKSTDSRIIWSSYCGDDFVVITEDEHPRNLCQRIIQNFWWSCAQSYDENGPLKQVSSSPKDVLEIPSCSASFDFHWRCHSIRFDRSTQSERLPHGAGS